MAIGFLAICSTGARSTKCGTGRRCRCCSCARVSSCRGARRGERLFIWFGAWYKHRYNCSGACSIFPVPLLQTQVKVLFLTNEYPPHIYGGAGVHVGYLSRELAKTIDVDVRCFGDQDFKEGRLKVTGFELDTSSFTCPKPLQSVFGALRRCIDFNTTNIDADLVHCHTWYSHFGGIVAKLNYGIPLVITTHSLEPLRPWKREQLAGGYDFSVWVEKTALEMADAIIAVSGDTKRDIERLFDVDQKRVHVIHNGIDLEEYRPVKATGT